MKVYQKIASLDLFPPYRKPGIDGKKQESACQRSLALRKPKRLAALSQSWSYFPEPLNGETGQRGTNKAGNLTRRVTLRHKKTFKIDRTR